MLVLLVCAGVAYAGGRKRIVVLDFEGPKADKFHDDLVKLIKKQHTVVPTDKWNGAADELDAAKVTEKNVKKVARKLKIDGIVSGKIEKRRDEYIVQLKLRAGTSGEMVGERVDTKSDGPRLDSKAQRDIKDELLSEIEDLESNHGGGGGDDDADDDKPSRKKAVAKSDDDDDSPRPSKKDKKARNDDDSDDDSAPAKRRPFSKKFDKASDDDADSKPEKKDKKDKRLAKSDDDDDSDAKPTKKDKGSKRKADKADKTDDDTAAALATKKDDDDDDSSARSKKRADKSDDDSDGDSKKKVAKKGDDDDGSGDADAEADSGEPAGDMAEQLSVSERAIDATVGLSLLVTRRLSYDYAAGLTGTQVPPHYGSTPAPGAVLDVTAYPLAWGHKRKGPLTGLGVELVYDKVLKINSQKAYGPQGMQKVADLATSASHFELAAVFRYPLGKGEKAPVVGGRLGYVTQAFTIEQTTPDGSSTDLPNVHYSMIEPGAFVRYPAIPKLVVGADISYLLVSGVGTATGDMGNMSYYGPTSASGYSLSAVADYQLTPKIFARGMLGLESVSMTFSTDPAKAGMQVFNRDSNATTQDVTGAHDLYFGASGVIGFTY
ncbi:MAG: hypothetical protein ACM31C_26695 [Acidobacteriota bacterium]